MFLDVLSAFRTFSFLIPVLVWRSRSCHLRVAEGHHAKSINSVVSISHISCSIAVLHRVLDVERTLAPDSWENRVAAQPDIN
jgi:hypothetical protein